LSRVAIVASDLMIATRISDAASAAGREVIRVDSPADLPPADSVAVAFVDWAAREPGWGAWLAAWSTSAPESSRPRLVVFGPHTDRAAHDDARAAGLGPMLARSKLVADLPRLV
jgi:hypothetical protein